MKALFLRPFHLVRGFFFIIILISSCQKRLISPGKHIERREEEEAGKGFTEFEEAMWYEFNMLKNPATGRIPDGSFDAERAQAAAVLQSQEQNKTTSSNAYTFQGPNNLGGRTRTLVYDVRYNGTSNQTIFAGGVSGGVYKSYDNGANWVRKSPPGSHFSCTSIAQDTRAGFMDTWYYTVGEALGNSASVGSSAFYLGNGVYKSTDNGESWSLLTASNPGSLETFDYWTDLISKVVVDPTNGYVYVAALDGIFRSIDGGTSWSAALTSGSSGFSSGMLTDITVSSTGRFYAAFSGFCNSLPVDMPGVWTSTTGASGSWTKIAGSGAGPSPVGWNATGAYGRVVLAQAPSLSSRVYALYYSGSSPSCPTSVKEAEFFYWNDGTSTWTDISASLPDEAGCSAGNDPFAVQGGYDLVIAVKPDDPATVFIGGTNIYRSTNTGATWTRIGGYATASTYGLYANSHPDIHSIVIQPTSSTTMLCGNDGGIQRTTDNLAATVAWTKINTGYRTYQYYYVDIDPRVSNDKVMGGAQDNGTTRNIGGTGTNYESIFGGDGVSVGLSDLVSGTQYEYLGYQSGEIVRRPSTDLADFGTIITPTGEYGSGLFVTLFKLDPDNTERLYYANDNSLYRTTTASTVTATSWTAMTGIAASVGGANDITAIAITRGTYSAATSSLFMGTSNGKVYRLDDPTGVAASTSPVNITGAAFPASGNVSSIAVNPRNDDTVIVTFSNYGVSSVFWTGNANAATPTWTAVEGSISVPSFRSSAIAVTPAGVSYFVGTSAGLYNVIGLPGTTTWTQEASMGNAVVSSLALRTSDNKMLVGTHGYGMWYTYLPRSTSVAADYFRSVTSGNWNDPATWESSPVSDFSAALVSPATLTPDNTANTINILSGHTVTVTASVTTDQTFINPGASLVVTGSTLTVINNGLTIQSTSAGTGRIGNSTGTISGNAVVERYIKLRTPGTGDGSGDYGRAYRLLTPTVNTSTTINSNWQEGQMNSSIGTNVNAFAGYGTHITGTGGNTNGFDVTQSNAPSLYFTTNGTSLTYTAVTNTNSNTLNAKTGYFLYLRGDRSVSTTLPLTTNMPTTHTTLRATGTLVQGTQTSFTNAFSAVSGAMNLVTNPYPSPIDWNAIYTDVGTTNLSNYYTYWDPNVGTRGGFVTVTNGGAVTPTPSGGIPAGTTIIQPGQAFFVTSNGGGTPTLSIKESHKTTGNINGVFRGGTNAESFCVTLFYTEPSGYRRLADGVTAIYDNSFSNGIDDNDAFEINNWDENIAIKRNNDHLAVESRPVIKTNDTLPLFMNNMKQQNYEFEFRPNSFTNISLKAELIDNFLKTRTLLSVTDSVVVAFAITPDPASAARDRFMIVFGAKEPVAPVTVGKPGIVVYPNPVQGNSLGLRLINIGKGIYSVKLYNNLGQMVLNKELLHQGGTATQQIDIGKGLMKGAYQLLLIGEGVRFSGEMIKVGD